MEIRVLTLNDATFHVHDARRADIHKPDYREADRHIWT